MKKVFAVILCLIILCSCSAQESSAVYIKLEEACSDIVFDMVKTKFEGDWSYFLNYMDLPNNYLMIQDLINSGYYDDIILLQKICDDAGYYDSAMFGRYVGDASNKTIHYTDEECFLTIKPIDLIIIGPAPTKQYVIEEVYDDDSYLENYAFCFCCQGKD